MSTSRLFLCARKKTRFLPVMYWGAADGPYAVALDLGWNRFGPRQTRIGKESLDSTMKQDNRTSCENADVIKRMASSLRATDIIFHWQRLSKKTQEQGFLFLH